MTLENEYLFGYATSMEERVSVLDTTIDNYTLKNLKKWKDRKSLLSEADFQTMLKFKNLSEVQYDLAVSPLNDTSLKKLYTFVKQQNWFKLHKKIFSIPRIYTPKSLEAALHFHVKFYMDFVSSLTTKYPMISFDSTCINSIEKNITAQFMELAQKTLVWDVRSKLENISKNTLNETEAFNYYLTHRFGTNTIEYFFLEYPTLTRLLSERLMYAMDNLEIIINSIKTSKKELSTTFGIKPPFSINNLQSKKGDSHNKGKTTTILEINHVLLVYKFRDNNILRNYNLLLNFIQKNKANFSLYKSKYIIGKNFCIEEFICNENCATEKEIIEYYQNYGSLAALTYWLGSTDLHKDNLVAKGKYPVLIDIETLFRTEERRIYSDDFAKIKYFETNSAISTGMLPMYKYWKKQIDYSALNGMKQKLPFKVRRLLNESNGKIGFELCEAYTSLSNNIPKLNGCHVTYKNYCQYIIKSFEEMLSWLCKNSKAIYTRIYEDFHTSPIRVVLRDTQDYHNFLDFSTHPSCMVDYIEREKIFENLWSNSFVTPQIALHEIAALYRHDIPYFYTLPYSKDIYFLDGKIDNYFHQNIFTNLKEHCDAMNQYTMEYSSLLLEESLNTLSSNCKIVNLSSFDFDSDVFINKAVKIANIILQNVITSNKNNAVLWPELITHGSVLSIDYPDTNLYNGTSGLLIFFYYLNEVRPDPKYRELLRLLEYEVFNTKGTTNLESSFHGIGSKIAVAFINYYLKKEVKYKQLLTKFLPLLYEIAPTIDSWDWIRGKSSLLALLTTIYEELQLPIIKSIMEVLILDIDNINMTEISFAHGYCGILYALLRANTILHQNHIEKKILEIYQIITIHLQEHKTFSPAWCNGTLGINKSLFEFAKYHPHYCINFIKPQNNYIHNTSCICHGSFCEVSAYYGLYKNIITVKESQKIAENFSQKEIFLCQYKRFLPLGFFNGLSGIGYQLLRFTAPKKYIDLLFFENISYF